MLQHVAQCSTDLTQYRGLFVIVFMIFCFLYVHFVSVVNSSQFYMTIAESTLLTQLILSIRAPLAHKNGTCWCVKSGDID